MTLSLHFSNLIIRKKLKYVYDPNSLKLFKLSFIL